MESKSLIEKANSALHLRLLSLQRRIVNHHAGTVIVIGGGDRLAASELANQLTEWLDSRLVRICAPDTSLPENKLRPFLWPYWNLAPAQGRITIVVGDWTTRSVVASINGELKGDALRSRVKSIKNFEDTLVANGIAMAKVWIDTPEKTLKKRLSEAEDTDAEGWVVSARDLLIGKKKNHQHVKTIRTTSSGKGLPWKIINGSDSKRRNLVAGKYIADQLNSGLRRKIAKVSKPSSRPRGLLEIATAHPVLDKKDYSQQIAKLQWRLGRLSRIAAKRGISTLVVLEGVDAAGKGGVIRRIASKLDAAHYHVHPIPAPTPEEKSRHYLWRFWVRIPPYGHMAIFDRSWYGRVIVERVEGFCRTDEWARAYSEINDFEARQAEVGSIVLKFWIHISKEEQLRRFHEREKSPHKRHKMTKEDYRNRKKWDDNQRAAEDMIVRTDTPHAPWIVIPGNDKRYARVAVLKALCRALADRLD
jgi:polyphosphate:AMP phosphotransferase